MPVTVSKTHGKYRVSTPNQVHAKGTTKKNAERQARLLRAIDHGWHPTGKAAKESVQAQAHMVVDAILEYDFAPDSPRPGSKEDPWRQTTGPLGKMKFLKKKRTFPELKPGLKKPEPMQPPPKPDRFKWKPEALIREVDEIASVPIPASAKRYARISGMRGLRDKQQLYINMCRDLGNRGKSTKGFPNHDGSEYTAPRKEAQEIRAALDRLTDGLERHHTEKTTFGGGKYGKGVQSQGKTSGKFKMPGNWSVGHAMKY